MMILVLNCGSSSVKFRLFQVDGWELLAGGLVERIGSKDAAVNYRRAGKDKIRNAVKAENHEQAIDLVLKTLCDPTLGVLDDIHKIDAIGHRVVHGAETFTEPALINEAVLRKVKECVRFAPLHNPPNISGIEASLYLAPFARQIAVFDTAFHQTMKPEAFVYALPYEWYEERRVRRYGFHGTSHRYVAQHAARLLGRPIEELKMVTCHLGNGASVAAVKDGKSVDTSMGFTPVEGLVMGTRCGDVDASLLLHVMEDNGLSPREMDTVINKKSGLFGITGGDNDLRAIEEKAAGGSERHRLALKILTRKVTKYIGAYAAIMGGLDCIVFTAGIGENSPVVRHMVCENLTFLGVNLDEDANLANKQRIGTGPTEVLVVPTDEELAIAEEVQVVLAREAGTPAVSVAPEGRKGMAKILTIDDDPDIRAALVAILESADYECYEAATMRAGLIMIPEVRPDLILLDVMMEDISAGFRLARELRDAEQQQGGKRVPILMVSGVEKVTTLKFRDRVGTDTLPVDGFLDKPVEPAVLLRKVKELLAK